MAVSGAELTATVVNSAVPGVRLNLTLRAHGPVLRLLIDEPVGGARGRPRYAVPDVLLPGGAAGAAAPGVAAWTPWKAAPATAHTWSGTAGDVSVKLTFASLKMEVAVRGQPAIVLNGRSLFNFEHATEKQVRSYTSAALSLLELPATHAMHCGTHIHTHAHTYTHRRVIQPTGGLRRSMATPIASRVAQRPSALTSPSLARSTCTVSLSELLICRCRQQQVCVEEQQAVTQPP